MCGCHTAHAEGNLLLCLIRLDAWDAPWQSWGRSMRLADRRQWNSLGPVHRPQVADDPLVVLRHPTQTTCWQLARPPRRARRAATGSSACARVACARASLKINF